MMRRTSARVATLCAVGAVALGAAWFANQEPARAADHTDPPSRVGTPGAATDIGDLYAWHSADQSTLTIVLTFSGPLAPVAGQMGNYDPDVLYGIHIDNNGDNAPNHDIWFRFAQNDLGEWGVQAQGVPGEAGPIQGAVESTVNGAGAKLWTGLRDDPFFFDLQGFQDTVMTGNLSFDSTRDSFAGANITAIVLEVPLTAALGGGTDLQIWATTATL